MTISCGNGGYKYPPGEWEIYWYGAGDKVDYNVKDNHPRVKKIDRRGGTTDFEFSGVTLGDSGEYKCIWDSKHVKDGNKIMSNGITFNVCSPKCTFGETQTCALGHDRICGEYWRLCVFIQRLHFPSFAHSVHHLHIYLISVF